MPLLIMILLYISQLSALPNVLALGDAFMMSSPTLSTCTKSHWQNFDTFFGH